MATLESVVGLAEAAIESGGQLQSRELAREVVPSGFRTLDALLPGGGMRRGSLVEWIAEDGDATGGGAVTLAFAVACRLACPAARHDGRQHHGTIVVIDRAGWFHPPAVLPWLEERHLVVARPSRDEDEIWAIDQALRCRDVAAVLAWPRAAAWGRSGIPSRRSRPARHWTTAMRRWQLAARGSGAVGLLVRPRAARAEPSWAEARISVAPLPGGTLLERHLRLAAVGGAWPGADPDAERWAKVSIDLARGIEAAPRIAVGLHGAAHPRTVDGGPSHTFAKGAAACRAS